MQSLIRELNWLFLILWFTNEKGIMRVDSLEIIYPILIYESLFELKCY